MEISSCCYYILISCVLFFPYFVCKPVSLNDIIAAEQRSASLQTPQIKVSERKTTRESPKIFKTFTLTKHMTSGSIGQTNKKISPLKYRKAFQIRTPLRPKKIKYSYKPRSRRLNAATKREIDNDTFNRNYIPLLKSLSVLFNNILSTDSGDDDDTDEYYNKRRSISGNDECPCALKTDYETPNREPPKKATAIASSITTKVHTEAKTIDVTQTTSTSAYNTVYDNISPLRRNKNVPVLPTGDSISSRRNYNGFGERSLSTYNRNFEGYIAGNNGSNENNNSGREATESYTENYKQYTDSSSRDDASRDGPCREIGRNRNITSTTATETQAVETFVGSNETSRNDRGDSDQSKGLDKLETRRNKTESRILLSQSSSRLRRFESQEETTEIVWQIESPKESTFDITYNVTRNQRFFNRNGSVAPEDQEIRRANQKLTLDDLTKSMINTTSNLSNNIDKQKIVVIYDGYSVTRDANGENKLSEKAYRIYS